MQIVTPGQYRLTADFSTYGARGQRFCRGKIITISNVDHVHERVIGPDLPDWVSNDMPVEPVTDVACEPQGD